MAGESAREQALRQRAKAARLIESADRWERGANGEVAVAAALVELEASGWTLRHDVAWPGRKYANIDHVAIGNGHVFVIDTKNWTGEVAATGGLLRQNGRSPAKEVAAVAEAARAVADSVPGLVVADVRPVLCLKMAAVLAALAVLWSQPAWFTSSLHRGSEEFVSLIFPTTAEPAPAETPAPVKDRKRKGQGKAEQK